MLYFTLKRLALAPFMLFLASLFIFLLIHLGPSDPAMDYLRLSNIPPTNEALETTRQMLGLNRPLLTQYLHWLGHAVQGDFGLSFATGRPVFKDLLYFLPATLELAGVALLLTLLFSIPLGILSARYPNQWPDHLIRFISLLGVSIPNFWLALLLIWLFPLSLHLLPPMGKTGISSLIMPSFTVAFMSLAINARLLRGSMLEVSGQRHVLYARLRGLSKNKIEKNHIFFNASLPMINALGMYIAELIAGTLIIESIFSWPGLGRFAVSAILNRDYPVIQCFTLFMVLIFILCNLCVDLFCAWIDPREQTAQEVKK
ncbi:nickel ABC transporter permease subunit NikB [Acetobacteraceae bacterium]|nr:nickel ABC transporter permease subunit NikB [Acetobacteraceae bacterium]